MNYSSALNAYYTNTDTNNRDQEIDILKSTINNLMQEHKQPLESNKQLKLRDFITNVVPCELETQIQLISAWSKCCWNIINHLSNFHNDSLEE